jgi:hypothetical protein
MFKMWSVFSPEGTPHDAALLAAPLAEVKQGTDEGRHYVLVNGLNERFFLAKKGNELWIQTPGALKRLGRVDADEFLLAGVINGKMTRLSAVEKPKKDGVWTSVAGEETNLLELDKLLFGDSKDGQEKLPLVQRRSSDANEDRKGPLNVADGFLSFVKKEEGPIAIRLKKDGAGIAVTLETKKRRFLGRFEEGSWEALKVGWGVEAFSDGRETVSAHWAD